jgi:hypothetical protein
VKGVVIVAVIASPAPNTYAVEFCRHFSLVAKKMDERICGPAIITNAIGSIFAMLTIGHSTVGLNPVGR